MTTLFRHRYIAPGNDYATIHRMVDNRGLTACGRRLKLRAGMAAFSDDVEDRRPDLICKLCRRVPL